MQLELPFDDEIEFRLVRSIEKDVKAAFVQMRVGEGDWVAIFAIFNGYHNPSISGKVFAYGLDPCEYRKYINVGSDGCVMLGHGK